MAIQNDAGEMSRPPTIEDLVNICKRLNEEGVKTKKTIRPKDKEDLLFLMNILEEEKK